MVKYRSHSIAFKRQVAEEFLGGETLHGLARPGFLTHPVAELARAAECQETRAPSGAAVVQGPDPAAGRFAKILGVGRHPGGRPDP